MNKEFTSIQEFALWIKDNSELVGIFPLFGDFYAGYENLGRGCSCKRNAKIQTLKQIFLALVSALKINGFAKNKMKDLTNSEKIIFNISEFAQEKIEIE